MRGRKQKQRDLLLTTLIDLLVQILFLFLLMIAVVIINGNKARQKADEARQVEKSLGLSLGSIAEKWRRLVDPEGLQEEQKIFLLQKADYTRLKKLEAQFEEREKRVKEQEKALGNALGYRPCWGTSRRTVDSLFKVRLSDNGIMVIKDWPPYREKQAKSLPITPDNLDRIMDADSFRAAFKGVYEVGRRNNCVYYVLIEDGTMSVTKSFEYSQVVEVYFYPLTKRRISP